MSCRPGCVLIVRVGELCMCVYVYVCVLRPCGERRADWSSLLKVSCRIDTNMEHLFATRLGMWILATDQPCGCVPALTFMLCLNPGEYQ